MKEDTPLVGADAILKRIEELHDGTKKEVVKEVVDLHNTVAHIKDSSAILHEDVKKLKDISAGHSEHLDEVQAKLGEFHKKLLRVTAIVVVMLGVLYMVVSGQKIGVRHTDASGKQVVEEFKFPTEQILELLKLL